MGCYESYEEILQRFPGEKPDVLLLAADSLKGFHLGLLPSLRKHSPGVPIILLSDRSDAAGLRACLNNSCAGYLAEPRHARILEDAVRCVAAGQVVFPAEAMSKLTSGEQNLAPRDEQVLEQLAAGSRMKDVAAGLGVSEGAVHSRVHRICKKLGVRNKKAALQKFRRLKLWPFLHLAPTGADGAKPQNPFTTSKQFRRLFATEKDCEKHLVELRWPLGFCCPECGSKRGWETSRGAWTCKGCRCQISVTRLPLRLWFLAAWEITAEDKDMTATSLMRTLSLPNYKTAWRCWRKLQHCLDQPSLASNDTSEGRVTRAARFDRLLRKALQTAPEATIR